MRVPSYCFKSLENIFYFRMKVPKELQQLLGRHELKKSLRTKDKATAIRLCRQYVITAENTFAELRLKLFQASLATDNTAGQLDCLPFLQVAIGSTATMMNHPPPWVEQHEMTMSKLIELWEPYDCVLRGSSLP